MKCLRKSGGASRNEILVSSGGGSEFLEAIDYYEDCERGLGYDFSIEVSATIQNIVTYPTTWPVIEEDIRRCLVHRFPYGVVYSIEQGEIFILAVMHLRRHPDYWKSRY